MKKKILSILFLGVLVLGLTGCGSVKPSGRYEWKPYKDTDGIYAYYDFKGDNECTFAMSMTAISSSYSESPQNYTYTINKIDKTNYEIVLTHVSKDEKITLTYNSKDNTIIDEQFKDIEQVLESKGAKSDNDVYGLFKKVNK